MTEIVHPSARDRWLVVTIWLAAAAAAVGTLALVAAPGPLAVRLPSLLLDLSAIGLMLWVIEGTRYHLEDDELLIRSGPFRWRMALREIEEIQPSDSLISGPALSTRRLAVHLAGRRRPLLISPMDRDLFMAEIAARAPHLVRRGDRLVRRSTSEHT